MESENQNKNDFCHRIKELAAELADLDRDWLKSSEKIEERGPTITVGWIIASFFAGLATPMVFRWFRSCFRPNETMFSGLGWHVKFVLFNFWPIVAFAAILAIAIGFLAWLGFRHSVSRRRHLLDERKERNSMNKFLLQHFLPMGTPIVHDNDATRSCVPFHISKRVQINHASDSDGSPDPTPVNGKGDDGSGESIGDQPESESVKTSGDDSNQSGPGDSTATNPERQTQNQSHGSASSFATSSVSADFNTFQSDPYNQTDFEQ